MRKTLVYLCVLIWGGVLTSCNPFGVQGPEPAFININEAVFTHDVEKGPRIHRIEHVEVFFEGFSIGFYELPAKFAVIPTMEVSEMQIFPAVEINGDLTAITKYEAMADFDATQAFIVGETYEINPQFDYRDNIIFDYVETFESGNSLTFDADMVDSTNTIRFAGDASAGEYSCLISTEANGEIITATSVLFTGLVNPGKDVFVEFEYKSDREFTVGMRAEGNGNSQFVPFISMAPRSGWRKVYLDITRIFIDIPAAGYRLFIGAQGGEGDFSNDVLVDNLKILHQE